MKEFIPRLSNEPSPIFDSAETRRDFSRQVAWNRAIWVFDGYLMARRFGLELLSSVHWVMRENAEARESSEAAAAAVHKWNPRKRRVMKKEHLLKAWQRLKEQSWDVSFAIA